MTDDVLISVEGGVGRIRLNRPKAIHALTTGMCEVMSQALLKWRADPAVQAVIIDHAEGRGFCAGGDVVMLARSGDTDAEEAKRFFFAEYRLNHLLFTYPKPTIAIMDGITMGGGVGISLPCDYRVATENTRLAMPETGIGLFPDVGGGWYLSRLPGRVGQFMVLTGARLDAGECHYLHLATHYVEQSGLPALVERILKAPDRAAGRIWSRVDDPARCEDRSEPAADRETVRVRPARGRGRRARSGRGRLGTHRAGDARDQEPAVVQGLAAAARRRRDARELHDEMRAEYALAGRVVRTHDFREGVRALLIDKDNAPQWDPATPEEVTDEMLDVLFAPLPDTEAWTPFPETVA